MEYQKPHDWNPDEDPMCCVECEREFKTGDRVYTDCIVSIHEQCLETYGQTLRKLGLR